MKFNNILARVLLLTLAVVLFGACDQNKKQANKNKEEVTTVASENKESLANEEGSDSKCSGDGCLGKENYKKYTENYLNSKKLSSDKLKTIVNSHYKKMEYKLYDTQKIFFFQYLKDNPKTELQIQWGYDIDLNLLPILTFRKCTKQEGDECTKRTLSENYLLLEEMVEYSVEGAGTCTPEEESTEVISYDCAGYMEDQWKNKIAADKHGDYFITKDGRIKYHTFKTSVTDAILKYVPSDPSKINIKNSYFTLHVGSFPKKDDSDTVAKMIIHVHFQPKDSENGKMTLAGSRSYYEFARPCPAYCPDTASAQQRLQ